MPTTSEDMKTSLMECIKDPTFLTVLREEVMAPIIRSLVSEAVAERDREISELRRELREVRTEMNALEQYSRRSCLNISGVPEARDESTDNIVRDVAAAAGVTLGPTDIDCSHRLGRQQDGKSRTIIVKLTSQNTRDKLYEARKHLRTSRSTVLSPDLLRGIFISENLTKKNQLVMYTARRLKRRGKLHSAWTDNCRMKIRLRANGPTRVIHCMENLRDLVGDQPEFADLERTVDADEPTDAVDPEPDADGFLTVGRGGTRTGSTRGRGGGADRRRGRSAGL